MMMYDVVIVGAGICGLTAAYRLSREGMSVLVLESSGTPGRVIQTIEEQGFRVEVGPNTFQSSGHAIINLCEELSLTPISVSPRAKKRYIYHLGRLCPVPTGLGAFLSTPLLSPGAKLRVLTEPFHPAGKSAEESVAAFTRRRLGPEVLDTLMGPFLSGVYAGDPEALSMSAVFPRLAEWEQTAGSLLKGALKARPKKNNKRSQSKRRYELLSFEQGMAALPQALAEALPSGALRLNCAVTGITPKHGGYEVTVSEGAPVQAQAVLLATPAYVSARLLADMAPEAAATLQEIPYAPIAIAHLGFPREQISHPLDGFGFLVPRKAGVPLLGSIWSSSLFEGRSPQGQVLLTCFLGGALHPKMLSGSDQAIVEQVLSDLCRVFHQPELSPSFIRVIRYERAIPQYTLGHQARIQQIRAAMKPLKGIMLVGNYFQGVSTNDCVKVAEQVAVDIMAQTSPVSACSR